MAHKFLSSLLVLGLILAANAATSALGGERVALYVKDSSNPGQLRFLGGGLSSNAEINQLITQKQDLLEQFRPASTGTGNWGTATGGWGTGVGTATGTATGTGIIGGFGGNGNGVVTPIYVNAGGNGGNGGNLNGGGGGGNAALNAAILNGSPVADLLPQIVSQAVLTRRGGAGGVRRRRPNRRGNRPQVLVLRP